MSGLLVSETATPSPAPSSDAPPRPSLRARLEALFAEYGRVAIIVYFVIFGTTWVGFAVALGLGFEVGSATGGAGLVGASYLATKVTQPLRIGATLVLTPIVGLVTRRTRDGADPGA